MKKNTPFTSGFPKTCWGCGQPFTVRHGHAEAIVGSDNQLYCDRPGCEDDALMPFAHVAAAGEAVLRAA